MHNFIKKIKSYNTPFLFLFLTLSVLPSFEAPKNIFIFLFALSWLFLSVKNKDWGGGWRLIDTIFLVWIIVDIVVGINAVIAHDQPISGSKDIVRFVLFGWIVSRIRFSGDQAANFVLTAAVFLFFALVYSYSNCDGGTCIELNSVGHVNHTAIYILIVYTVSLLLFTLNFKSLSRVAKITLPLLLLLFAYAVIDTRSRSASGLLVFNTLLIMLYLVYYYRTWRILVILGVFTLSFITFVSYNPPSVIDKFKKGSSLIGESPRQRIRNFAYYVFKIDPVLGTGMGNFPNYGHKDIKSLVEEEEAYDKNNFFPYSHPHNVYWAYLSGGGVLLFAVFAVFWMHMASIIYRVGVISSKKWLVFSGFGVMIITLTIGWVNTTLAHEHALISMFILGLLISEHRKLEQ